MLPDVRDERAWKMKPEMREQEDSQSVHQSRERRLKSGVLEEAWERQRGGSPCGGIRLVEQATSENFNHFLGSVLLAL